jgi:YD repeat-containing protein
VTSKAAKGEEYIFAGRRRKAGNNTLGRLTGLAYTKGGTNLFTAYGWSYDSLASAGMSFGGGNGATDPRVAATAASAVYSAPGRVTQMTSQDGTSTYSYDITSQLTAATHTFQTNESYSYDDNGNRDMTGYLTGDDNQMTNDGTFSYTYDEEGNRTQRTHSTTGDVTEYEWDYRNRLTKVTEKNSSGTTTQVVEYIYDVFDRRIGKEVDTTSPFTMTDAAIERYVYDDIHTSLASLDGGNVVLDFVDDDASDSTVAGRIAVVLLTEL